MHWIVGALDHGNRTDRRSDSRAAVEAFLGSDPYSQAELFHRTEIFDLHADHVNGWRTVIGRIAS